MIATAPQATPPQPQTPEIFYPSSDGEPLAETSLHVDVIITLVVLLRQYLQDHFADRAPLILADQFVYYAENFPRLRFAPDVAVIFGVAPGPRDNYKIWQEKQVPTVIFEITSPGTQQQDQEVKKDLYEKIGVQEYWLFDPKGEWIPEQLRGYRLVGEDYQPILDAKSLALGLRFQIEGPSLALYQLATGEKLLTPEEVAAARQAEVTARQAAEADLAQAQQRAEQLAEKLRQLGIDPDAP
ncbi:MAG: Uma2 family endonuclease [Prochlorothrix sp.]